MKQQKYTIYVSLSFIVVPLAVYFIGAFCCFYGNEIVKDIFIAIFSSAFFVFFLSIIGYRIEKQLKKDKELKSLINNDILNFAKLLYDLKSYNLEQQFKANILKFRINEMIKQHENLADKITNWMERKKFILGTPFVFDREQYELTTLDLIEKAKKAESD